MAVGLLLFASAPVHADYVTRLLPVMLLLGVGAGLSFPSLMTIAMSGAEPHEAGLASGLVNTSMQVGGALGLAVLATLSASRAKDVLAAGAGLGGGDLQWAAPGAGHRRRPGHRRDRDRRRSVLAPARALGQAPAEVAEQRRRAAAAARSSTPRPPERARARPGAATRPRPPAAPRSAGTGRTACPG